MTSGSTTRRELLATGTAAAALGIASAEAQSARRTFVLVHGAWHGGWCWRRVADRLEAQGHKVFAPTLTGLGERSHLLEAMNIDLATHITDLTNVFRFESLSDVVLCGHSYGGMVVSGAMEKLPAGAVRALVFLDAFVPADGEALAEIASPAVRQAIAGLIAQKATQMKPVPAAAFKVNEQDRAWVDAMCTPHPLATMTDKITLTGAREKIGRKTYVRAAGYPSPSFDEARTKAASGGWRALDLPCGHDAMVDMPDRLAEILVEAA
jgi:pimeloyl-ACP methyl ester carboxylesterase